MLTPFYAEVRTVDKVDLRLLVDFNHKLRRVTESDIQQKKALDLFLSYHNVNADLDSVWRAFPTLRICRAAAKEFMDGVAELSTYLGAHSEEVKAWQDNPPNISGSFLAFSKVLLAAKEFETVLQAELQTLAAYQVEQKGAYSIDKLVESAQEVFPPSTLRSLNAPVISEIRQAGRCLAYDVATACGFHTMRAVELVMHGYYLAVLKPAKTDRLPDWGSYIKAFRTSEDVHAHKAAELLQHLKDQHRNLIMHPDIVLSDDEAASLFELGKATIIVMSEKLPPAKRSAKDSNAP